MTLDQFLEQLPKMDDFMPHGVQVVVNYDTQFHQNRYDIESVTYMPGSRVVLITIGDSIANLNKMSDAL